MQSKFKTPTLTSLDEEFRSLAAHRKFAQWFITLFILLILITAFVVYRHATHTALTDFEKETTPFAHKLQKRLENYTNLLLATKALYAASISVEQIELFRFINDLKTKQNLPGTTSISFIERVDKNKKEEFVQNLKKELRANNSKLNLSSLGIYPQNNQDEYWAVKYIEPLSKHEKILGFDVLSNDSKQQLFESARDSGKVKISSGPALINKPKDGSDTLLFVVPIYRNETSQVTGAQRQNALIGFLALEAKIDAIFLDLIPPYISDKNISLELIDEGSDSTSKILVKSYSDPFNISKEPKLTKNIQIPIEDSIWTVRFKFYNAAIFSEETWKVPLAIIFGGLFCTLVMTWFFYRVNSTQDRLLNLVKEKTANLAETKELMTKIMDTIPAPLFLKRGADLTVQFWNKAMEELSGIKRTQILNLTGYELFPKEDSDSYLEEDQKVLEKNELVAIEETLTLASGEKKLLLTKKAPIQNSSDNSSYLLGICEDISSRRKNENERILSQKLQAVGSLASGIAHEINTPIQYISFNLHYLNDMVKSYLQVDSSQRSASTLEINRKKVEQVIHQSLEGVDRVIQIVGALHEFSHPGQSEMRSVELNKLIEDSVLICTNTWKHVAEVKLNLDPKVGSVQCFPNEIGQVFINLISNSADAIEEKGLGETGLIEITTKDHKDNVEIIFSDSGIGVPAEAMEKIYDPFFTTKDIGQGTGQGLSIARSIIVDRHKGTITCDSIPGQRTTFVVIIPKLIKETEEI